MKIMGKNEKEIILKHINNIKKETKVLSDDVYKGNFDKLTILSEFSYKGFYCTFFKDNNSFIFTYEKNNYVDVYIFNTFEEILCFMIDNRFKSNSKRSYKQ